MGTTIINIAPLIIWGIFGLSVLVFTLIGVWRGFFGTMIKTVKYLLSAIIAIPLTRLLSGWIFPQVVDKLLPMMLEADAAVIYEAPKFIAAIEKLCGALLGVIVYIPVFILVQLILSIVTLILRQIINGLEKNTFNKNAVSRALGAVCGACCSIVLFVALSSPILGAGNILYDVSDIYLNDAEAIEAINMDAESVEYVNALSGTVAKHPVSKFSWALGGKGIFNSVSSSDTEKGRAVLYNEITTVARISSELSALSDFEISSLGEPQVDALKNIAAQINEAKLIPEIIAGFLSDACTAWSEGKTFLGVEKPIVEPPANFLFDGVITMFADADAENISANLLMFADMIGTLNEYKIFTEIDSEEGLAEVLSDGEMVETLIDQLTSGENTEAIVGGLVDMSAGMLTEAIEVEGLEKDDILNLMDDVAHTLNQTQTAKNKEERIEAVSDEIEAFCSNIDVEVSTEDMSMISEAIVDILGEAEIDTSNSNAMYLSIISAILQSDILK